MNYQDVSQQAAQAGDVEQGNPETIITGDFMQMSNTADSEASSQKSEGNSLENPDSSDPKGDDADLANKKNADWRKSDKEWQKNKEKAEKLDKLAAAITGDDKPVDKNVDPAALALEQINELTNKLERSEWERKNLPSDISEDIEQSWKEACDRKADPEDPWSRLTYDEIWKLSIPVASTPAINQEVKNKVDQEFRSSKSNMALGSVNFSGTMPLPGDNRSELDRKIAEQMGWK